MYGHLFESTALPFFVCFAQLNIEQENCSDRAQLKVTLRLLFVPLGNSAMTVAILFLPLWLLLGSTQPTAFKFPIISNVFQT